MQSSHTFPNTTIPTQPVEDIMAQRSSRFPKTSSFASPKNMSFWTNSSQPRSRELHGCQEQFGFVKERFCAFGGPADCWMISVRLRRKCLAGLGHHQPDETRNSIVKACKTGDLNEDMECFQLKTRGFSNLLY